MRTPRFQRHPVALAVVATIAAAAVPATAGEATTGRYLSGDFHNHTTCSDGSISMQKLVKKSTDKGDGTFGLDWFVQAGHGGSGNRNCTLVEDASLATPAYPVVTNSSGAVMGPTTTWQNSNPAVQPKGTVSGTAPNQNMWRWQSVQEFQYPLVEYLSTYLDRPLFLGIESVVAGHEHTSMSVITGQIPKGLSKNTLPPGPGYAAAGTASALAQWQYCFDRAVTDVSRGNTTETSGIGNNWDCSVPGSLNNGDPSWNDAARKLIPAADPGAASNGFASNVGTKGHKKTLEALKWMAQYHPDTSYYIPAHLERAGPFNPDGNNGFNIEHLRNFNNAAPRVSFGFETQPGHGASSERGEYFPARNRFATSATTTVLVDSVGGTTWGGTGVYGAQIGGVWDALLGEGRNWWFFASSDWHNRGSFGPDDRRSTQDFFPGEYQRTFVMVKPTEDQKFNDRKNVRPQNIVDGLRTGNAWSASGQLIDRLAFLACPAAGRSDRGVAERVAEAAREGRAPEAKGCATMGEKLVVGPGSDVIVAIAVRDPGGANYAPYGFNNPSLLQVGIQQPLNKPVLDHVDVIRGLVTGYKTPGAADYGGEWPRDWVANPSLANVPAGAKNTSAALLRTFGSAAWRTDATDPQVKVMSFRLPAVTASQYLRLRGSNLPANVPFETDANGNPLPDLHTNATTTNAAAGNPGTLKIICSATGSNVPPVGTPVPAGSPPIDGCPTHLPVVNGVTYVAYDVAAWSDLWFYSNPIYVEVSGATKVAGVK